jgi:hypothetical protein
MEEEKLVRVGVALVLVEKKVGWPWSLTFLRLLDFAGVHASL